MNSLLCETYCQQFVYFWKWLGVCCDRLLQNDVFFGYGTLLTKCWASFRSMFIATLPTKKFCWSVVLVDCLHGLTGSSRHLSDVLLWRFCPLVQSNKFVQRTRKTFLRLPSWIPNTNFSHHFNFDCFWPALSDSRSGQSGLWVSCYKHQLVHLPLV